MVAEQVEIGEVEITREEREKIATDFKEMVRAFEKEHMRVKKKVVEPPKIVYCMAIYEERMEQVLTCLNRVRLCVDRCVIVVDDSVTEKSKILLRGWGCEIFYRKWDNHFSKQRNEYLNHVNEGEWVLVSDPDELHSQSLMNDLKTVVTEAEKRGINILGINAHDITTQLNNTVTETVSNWFKQLLFKFEEGVRYVGCVHETLLPGVHGWRAADLDKRYYYEHIKSMVEIKERGARNVFCGGGGNNVIERNPMYVELHGVAERLGLTDWPALREYIRKGNIDYQLKEIIITHRNDSGWDWENESRDFFLWYSAIHPFEMTRASLYTDKLLNSCGIPNCPLEILKQSVNTLDDTTMRRLSQIWSLERNNLNIREDGEEITLIKSKSTTEDIESFIKKNLDNMKETTMRSIQKSKEENISEERLKLLKDLETNVNGVAIKICAFLKATIESLKEKSLEISGSVTFQTKKSPLAKCKSCVLTAIELFIGNTVIKSTPQPPSKGSPPEVMAYVEEQYLKILGRNADDVGKQGYTEAILQGRMKREELPKILKGSQEHKEKHGL